MEEPMYYSAALEKAWQPTATLKVKLFLFQRGNTCYWTILVADYCSVLAGEDTERSSRPGTVTC